MLRRKALIFGIRGQDGRYLASFLAAKGYDVIGTTHQEDCGRSFKFEGYEFPLLSLNLKDFSSICSTLQDFKPDEIYNFAARASSAQLFDDPIATAEINGLAVVRILEAIRIASDQSRFCQASSSEIFAGADVSPQDESTPFRPMNAYGAAKSYASNMVAAYRGHHNLFAASAFLFNHESPLRSSDYVTRRITSGVAKIALGLAHELTLGNLESRRDWGFAGDYVRAMWLMLQLSKPEDFVIASGVSRSVREFCDVAFSYVGLNYLDYVKIDQSGGRRMDSIRLCGNPEKAIVRLGWRPDIDFHNLVHMMVDADLAHLKLVKKNDLE